MKTTSLILPILLLALAAADATEQQLQVRLLKVSGATPNEKMLKGLVDDPGAQVAPAISQIMPDAGTAKIHEVTPYRFADEFTPEGEPASFVTRDLGWTGSVTISESKENKLSMSCDLKYLRIGTPVVYDVKGVQMAMPVFTSFQTSNQEMHSARGEWNFVKADSPSTPDEKFFWAIRVLK